MSGSWRDSARPKVAAVLRATEGQSEAEIKKALFDAYPFGERRYTPYKIWLDEIRRQRGLKSKPSRKDQLKIAEWEQVYGRHA